MKAVRIHEFGGSDKMRVEDIPKPQATGDSILVRVRAAAVNPVDWMIREKIFNPEGADRVPMILGQDFAGVVEAVGPGAGDWLHKGDEVFGETWGAYAEYVKVPVNDLVPKPQGIDFITAASIPMVGLTAFQVINETAKPKPGMNVLIHGISGGVGSFAAQFARLRGAEVIGTASRESFDFLKSIGVARLIDYHSSRFEKEIKDVDVVIDPLGGETQARSWSVLKRGGMLINLIGEIEEKAAREVGAKGVLFAMRYDRETIAHIAHLIEGGTVKTHVTHVLPLDQAREALDLNQQGKSHGKIVLEVK